MLEADVTCAYRYTIANANITTATSNQPITLVGWSFGATVELEGGLTAEDRQALSCGAEVQLPEIVVPISGCHYQFEESEYDFRPF